MGAESTSGIFSIATKMVERVIGTATAHGQIFPLQTSACSAQYKGGWTFNAFDMKSDHWVTRVAADSEEDGTLRQAVWVQSHRLNLDVALTWCKIAK
jgi:hypothetical protein